uniref:STAS-like domain-containing protein n=1 Tax=uncultured Dysgonomonas sp. TaxID=206096 RepID=UPI0026344F79|nr:STAS-like domain-containing protein [uncultured Dysgonomonas sp.]
MIQINIANDYSKTPGARYESEGAYSGERFRTEILLPNLKKAINENSILEVVLDGTAGFGTSFLEEAFGGLIRIDKIEYPLIKKKIKFISLEYPDYIDEINEYLEDAVNNEK